MLKIVYVLCISLNWHWASTVVHWDKTTAHKTWDFKTGDIQINWYICGV